MPRSYCLVLSALMVAGPVVRGQDRTASRLEDGAGMFSESTRAIVGNALSELERLRGVPVVIETVGSLGGRSLEEATVERARASGSRGVYLLISKADKAVAQPVVHRDFAERLPEARRAAIRRELIDNFEKGEFDDGLLAAVQAIAAALGEPAVAVATRPGTGRGPVESPRTAPAEPTRREPPRVGTSGARVGESESETDAPLIERGLARLTLGGARKVLEAAESKAASMNLKVNIAIVDDGGHLLAFARMDGARPASGPTAMTKAITAATFRQATGPLPPGGEPDILLNLSLQNAAAASGGKVTTLYGGVPITLDGQIIGAVGVGGASGEQDAEIARAGIDALLRALGARP